MRGVTLVCGVQGAGKSWVCRQLVGSYDYIPHDRCWTHPTAQPDQGLDPKWGPKGAKSNHLETLIEAARAVGRPLLTESPFGERQLRDQLSYAGVPVRMVFITEKPEIIQSRYLQREGKPLPPGVLTRAANIRDRAQSWGAYAGTSAQVLAHLGRVKV